MIKEINKVRIFSRKPRASAKEFCRNFYDTNIFNASIQGIDFNESYAIVLRNSIIEADSSFSIIDLDELKYELTLLRIEIFSLAFLHHFGDKHSIAQNEFTLHYLSEKNKHYWNDLTSYNQAIAQSSELNLNNGTKSGRTYLAVLDSNRMKMFDELIKQGFDVESIARTANRIFTDVAWKNRLTANYLMLVLCDRLKCSLNAEAKFRLVAAIIGFYNGAKDSFKKVIIA